MDRRQKQEVNRQEHEEEIMKRIREGHEAEAAEKVDRYQQARRLTNERMRMHRKKKEL